MTQTADDQPTPAERAERATRIASMLARWEQEDVSGEPDWDVDDVEPMRLSRYVADNPKR